jgi:hypothetical protein
MKMPQLWPDNRIFRSGNASARDASRFLEFLAKESIIVKLDHTLEFLSLSK